MAEAKKQKGNRIGKQRQMLMDNKGSAIVMVLVAIAFVSIMGSMVMYSTFYNYKMKVVDRSAKDTFYSADLAMEEIREGLKKDVAKIFSEAYGETLENFGEESGEDKNVYFINKYREKLIRSFKTNENEQQYEISILQRYLSNPSANRGEYGAFIDSTTSAMLPYTDGIRLKDVRLTYTDEEGYVSIIETDFLLPYPNLGLGDTYEFPDIDEYCLIANRKFEIKGVPENKNSIYMKGSVYGGKEGVVIGPRVTMLVQCEEEELENGRRDKFITDGEIILGNMDNGATSYTPVFMTSENISLWASGVELNGTKTPAEVTVSGSNYWRDFFRNLLGINGGIEETIFNAAWEWLRQAFPWLPGMNDETTTEVENNNLMLMGESYIQDDITINASDAKVHLGGTYTGFGNTTTKAKNSSSIIINGSNATIDMSELDELNLGGNTYIGTSKLNVADVAEAGRKNEDVKMGNAVASKIEQLAYLVPAECVGFDVVNGKTVVGKNPVNVKDESYVQFMENKEQNPEAYKEVNLNLIDGTVGKPLSNYGASYEKVFFKADQETVWAYYYLRFSSTADASRFFADYYKASPEEIDKYLGQYIKTFNIGTLTSDKMNIVGNMITRAEDGTTQLHSATVGVYTEEEGVAEIDNTKQIELNKKYAECSNQFTSLCRKLTINYDNLTANERNADVYENLINTELIKQYVTKGFFANSYVVFENETAQTFAILILEGNGSPIDVTTAMGEALDTIHKNNQENREKVHLIVSQRPLMVTSNFAFKGTIITKDAMTIQNNSASFEVTNLMDDVMLGSIKVTYGGEEKKIEALSLFRDAKSSNILGDETEDEDTITADKLVVYENWTKK